MSERDAGFCSGGDEDDLDVDDVHSPTDASEDSVEVKVTPISPRNKNKRKCAEPRKVPNDFTCGPLKKRIRQQHDRTDLETISAQQNPFRPWSLPSKPNLPTSTPTPNPISPNDRPAYHPVYGYERVPLTQDEPLSLVKTIHRSNSETPSSPEHHRQRNNPVPENKPDTVIRTKEFARIPFSMDEYPPRVPPHPAVRPTTTLEHITARFNVDSLLSANTQSQESPTNSTLLLDGPSTSATQFEPRPKSAAETHSQKEQRNYKNMTRERRIEANARERTRVHTISAAFDTLRKAIPAYSHNQKLSKLSVLRIACSYILTLSRVAGSDYSADQSEPDLSDCVDLVGRTIQTEGKLRKKKDE